MSTNQNQRINSEIQNKFTSPESISDLSFQEFCKAFFTQFNTTFNPKYKKKKFDGHTHVWDIEQTKKCINFSKEFNISKILAIVDEDLKPKLDEEFPDMFYYARFIRSQILFQQDSKSALFDMIDEYYSQGYDIIKFWFAPRWRDYAKDRFNIEPSISGISDPIFEPLFSALEDRRLRLLLHTSDPDIWYEQKYQPASHYGTKVQHLKDLEAILQNYPNLTIQGAHLAAQPEHLDNISRWLDKFPNFTADLSSARWMAREFSKYPEKARNFIINYSDRIFFGSDLSYGRQNMVENKFYFYTRYLTYGALLETNVKSLPLPFQDPENNNRTVINGLNLPEDVLEKIYWTTPHKFFS